jgi:hypothetical protein
MNLVRCYPRHWRDRYGEELEALIVDMSGGRRPSLRTQLNVLAGAARERLNAGGLGLVLWAWALFVLGGAAVQKSSEHWQAASPTATAAFDTLVGGAIVTGLLVLGGIAVALPTFARRLGWIRIRRELQRAGAATLAALLATVGVVALARHAPGPQVGYVLAFLAWAALCAGCLLAWTAAAARAARLTKLPKPVRRLEAGLATAVAAAMAVMTTATTIWQQTAHRGLDGELALGLALMLAGTALGFTGARRSLLELA